MTTDASNELSIHHSFLPHDDADVGFWRDLLGFELRTDVGYGGLRWLTVGPPGQPATSIVLHPPAADPGTTDEERRVVTEMMAKGTFGAVVLAAADLDATFARLQAGGAEVMHKPTDQDWGTRDCAVRDPAGNMVRIQQQA